jgi:DNA-binding response OmpR family regulator
MGARGDDPAGARSAARPVAAVFNGDDTVVAMLCAALEEEGYRPVAGKLADVQRGDLDFVAFLAEHDPEVLVVDIPRPHERHLNFVRLLRAADPRPGRVWVITTVEKEPLEHLMTPLKWGDPIIGQPFGAAEVLQAVRKVREAAGRPARPADQPRRS